MKKLRPIFFLILLGFIIPQVTLAVWWKPYTWKVFSRPTQTVVEKKEIATTTPKKSDREVAVKVATSTPISKPVVVKPKVVLPTKLTNAEIIKKVKPAVVYVETDDGAGSGMIISADGYVLTNAHVVKGFTNVQISLSDESIVNGIVVGRDEDIDVALVKINRTQLKPAILGDSDRIEQGDEVFTLGFPFGIKGDVSFKEGTISRRLEKYLETSAEIHPGNSGGPLVNRNGQVVGINTAMFGKSISGVSLGETIKLAIPINIAKSLIEELKAGRNILSQKSSPNYTDASLQISAVRVIPSTYETVIKWETNLRADSKLTIWPTNTQSGNIVLSSNDSIQHEVSVSTNPGKIYYFIIEANSDNGGHSVIEQKEFYTPTDKVAPEITSVTVPQLKQITVTTDEPSIVMLTYVFEYTGDQDAQKVKKIYSTDPKTVSIFQVLYPSPWNDNTILHFSVSAIDKSLNVSSAKSYSILLRDIR